MFSFCPIYKTAHAHGGGPPLAWLEFSYFLSNLGKPFSQAIPPQKNIKIFKKWVFSIPLKFYEEKVLMKFTFLSPRKKYQQKLQNKISLTPL